MRRLNLRSSLTLALALASSLALASACSEDGGTISAADTPSTWAEALCDGYYRCGCDADSQRFSSRADCEAEFTAWLQEDIDQGEAAGLMFDESCSGDYVDSLAELGCSTLTDLTYAGTLATYTSLCKLFYGTKAPGESCETVDLGDDCNLDGRCQNGLCVGASATGGEGVACSDTSQCLPGLLCINLDSGGLQNGTCERLPAVGDTCLGAIDLCNFEAYCDQRTKTCAALPSDGSECSPSTSALGSRCDRNSVCGTDNVCAPAPQGGEPCVLKCADGFACEAGRCVVQQPLVCGFAG
jgi:hypothetical protein